MFTGKFWAAAFVNSLEKSGGGPQAAPGDFEDGFITFMTLASWISSLPDMVAGRASAEKLELLVRSGTAAAGTLSQAQETAVRFLLLLVKKNAIRHIDSVTKEIKKFMDKKRGIIAVSLEYAAEPDKEFESLAEEAIKKRTGASKVELKRRIIPELIGGYRLHIGDIIIDASIRQQLQKMEASLASGKEETVW